MFSLLCAGTSAGLFLFARSLPVMRTFHDQPYAGAIFQGFGSLTALGWHVALANLGVFAFWLASSLIVGLSAAKGLAQRLGKPLIGGTQQTGRLVRGGRA